MARSSNRPRGIIVGRDCPNHASPAGRWWCQIYRVSARVATYRSIAGLVRRKRMLAVSMPVAMILTDSSGFGIWVIQLAASARFGVSLVSFGVRRMLKVGELLYPGCKWASSLRLTLCQL